MDTLLAATVTTIPAFAASSGSSIGGSTQITEGGNALVSGSSSLDLASLAGTLVDVLALMAMAGMVGIIIIAIVANRADPDPTGRRPQSVYFFVVSSVTLTTAIAGSALVVASILWLTAHDPSSATHAIARLLLISALIFAASTGLFVTHLRRGLSLARAEGSPWNPSHRVGQSYVSVVAFVAILALLVTGVAGVYLIFAVASPGTFGSFGGRSISVRVLIELVYLALVALMVLWTHATLLIPRLAIFARTSRRTGSSIPPAQGPAPAVPTA